MRIYGRVKIEHSSWQKFIVALSRILLDKRVRHNRLAEQSNPNAGWEASSREACRLPASWPAPPSQRRKQNLGKQSGHFLRGSHSSNPGSRIDWLRLQSRELPDPKISLQKVFFPQQTSRDSMWIHCDEASAIQFHPMLGPTDESLGWKGSKRDQHQRQRGGGEAGGEGGGEAGERQNLLEPLCTTADTLCSWFRTHFGESDIVQCIASRLNLLLEQGWERLAIWWMR